MDDNQIATSDDAVENHDDYFAKEVPDEPAPKAEPAEPKERPPGHKEDPEDRRAALAAAFEKVEEGKTPEPKADSTAPEEASEQAPQDKPEDNQEQAQTAPPEQKQGKAPQSWKPEAREMFDKIPDPVKQEILRREQDINNTLQRTADERRIAQAYLQTSQKYEQMYQARGINSLQAAQNLFEADRILMTGNKQQRAAMTAKLITQYGVDLEELETHLVQAINQPAPAGPSQNEIALQQRLAQLEQQTFAHQRAVIEQEQAAVNNTVHQFASDAKNEFFNDVRHHMLALLKEGAAKDLQDAYDQACYANPEVRKVILQRDQANRQRAAAGTTSLPNKGPRGPQRPAQPVIKDRREAIEAAFAANAGGRV